MKVLSAGAAVLVGIGLSFAAAGTAHAAYPGGDGRIAYVYEGDIYTATPDGEAKKQLTRTGDAAGPRWSPDGTSIAFDRGGALWVMKANGSGARQVSGLTGAGTPAWSPDGTYLAVAANHYLYRVTVGSGATAHYRTDLSEGAPVTVYPTATPVAWSADGRKITAESSDCQNEGLAENCLATITLPSSTSLQGKENVDHPHGGGGDPVPGRAYDPDWTPTSSGYLYSELLCPDGSPTSPVYDCNPVQLVLANRTIVADASDGAYSPSGTRIVFVQADSRPLVLTANPDGSDVHGVAEGSQPDWQPTH